MKYLCPEEIRTQVGNLKYLADLRQLARQNRRNPTKAEEMIWKKLKKLKYPFLRQKPIDRFIIDFYCSKLLLAVEIDGDSHDKRKNYDEGRNEMLAKMRIITIRFRNERVLSDLKNVMEELIVLMKEREKKLF
ncbi:MAG: DUF559 domain-containing protein [Candidatus Shapirobacteria bacterium]